MSDDNASGNGTGNGTGRRVNGEPDDQDVLTTTGRDARRGSFGPGGGAGMPTERSDNFGAVVRRLGTILGRETPLLVLVAVLTVTSVVLVVLGPRLLGQATDIIVSGIAGDGIDFGALHDKLFLVGGIYAASWVLAYSQGYILAGSRPRSTGCRSATSISTPVVTSSAASPTTSTTCRRASSRRPARS